jgi:hypothetical protein
VPSNYPESVPPIPFSPNLDEDIKEIVSKFANSLKRTFEIFLKDNAQLPVWEPPLNLAEKTRRHITRLKIPIISRSSQLPLLLLHNLGQRSHDPKLAERVDRLFRQGTK